MAAAIRSRKGMVMSAFNGTLFWVFLDWLMLIVDAHAKNICVSMRRICLTLSVLQAEMGWSWSAWCFEMKQTQSAALASISNQYISCWFISNLSHFWSQTISNSTSITALSLSSIQLLQTVGSLFPKPTNLLYQYVFIVIALSSIHSIALSSIHSITLSSIHSITLSSIHSDSTE